MKKFENAFFSYGFHVMKLTLLLLIIIRSWEVTLFYGKNTLMDALRFVNWSQNAFFSDIQKKKISL